MSELITITQAAERFGVVRGRFIRAIKRGWPKAERDGKVYRLDPSHVESRLGKLVNLKHINDRKVIVAQVVELKIIDRAVESFETPAALQQYLKLAEPMLANRIDG